jgi:hypothetical protein
VDAPRGRGGLILNFGFGGIFSWGFRRFAFRADFLKK